MQTGQISYSMKKYLIPKLAKHQQIHRITNSFYTDYCKITGFLHVLPDFYIIGGQKCGTTSLFMYLAENPYINSAAVKDIRFFDKYFFKGVNWYKSYFPLKTQKYFQEKNLECKSLTIDATERYLDHPHAANRIKEVTPNAKFIILLRNPIDRAYSHYAMIKNRSNSGFEEKLSFEEAINEESKRIDKEYDLMKNDQEYYSDMYFRFGYLHRGLYFEKLKKWTSVFDKKNFLIIQSEEFFKNTSEKYKQVLDFLELPKWEPKKFVHYKKRNIKQPNMNPQTREMLIEYFRPHNKKLYELLGKEFDWDK